MRKLKKFKEPLAVIGLLLVLGLSAFYLTMSNDDIRTQSVVLFDVFESESLSVKESFKSIVGCKDKPFELKKVQDGSYWILKNYIRAEHGQLGCGDSITYTTHGDYTFLDNLQKLLPRWNAPISMALYAPGSDFNKTLDAIQYSRNCLPESDLIQLYVTFHIYFLKDHMPRTIPLNEIEALEWAYNCSLPAPYENVNVSAMYRRQHGLLYPINVGRNIARKASLTHLILASDIELYPNSGFVDQFMEMVLRNPDVLYGDRPRVFPLAVFEVAESATIPGTKTELQWMLLNKTAIIFHEKVCKNCHSVPNMTEWMAANETDELNVFAIGERKLTHKYWEPFYVSDNQEPFFDERVTWEGQKNKRIQGFAMCLLDYEFHLLNNAFMIHSPGIKVFKRDKYREKYVSEMNQMMKKLIIPEYQILYGNRKGCIV